MPDRENAGDGGSAADGRIELHRTTMELDEGTHDREAESCAAMLRAERVAFEAVEHALADVGWNAGAAVGHAEHDGVVAPLDRQPHHLGGGREADRVKQKMDPHLAHPSLVGHEAADVGSGAHVE